MALVTGPTSGLGAGFAHHLARAGYDLVLVARDGDRLGKLAGELREEGADSEILQADLSTVEGRDSVVNRARHGIEFLVNNAGFGTSGEFWTADPAVLQAQLDVNVTAVMQLTRAVLPEMIEAKRGSIINVASIAGLLAGRGSTYSASKAYVISFTEGLAGGLADTGVRIQALCPGFIRTEFHERAGIDMASVPDFLWLDVDSVVQTSLADLDKGRVISIPGVQYRALTAVGSVLPKAVVRRAAGAFGTGRGRT